MTGTVLTPRLPRVINRFPAGLYVTLFADASFCPHTNAYGWCFWAKFGDPAQTVVESGGGPNLKNSTAAEAHAIKEALKFAATIPLQGKIVVMQSDCISALNGAPILKILDGLVALGAKSAYGKHVKGHRGNACPRSAVNTLCDRRARAEMVKYRARNQARTE